MKANPGRFRNKRKLTLGLESATTIARKSLLWKGLWLILPEKRVVCAAPDMDDVGHGFTVSIVRWEGVIICKPPAVGQTALAVR